MTVWVSIQTVSCSTTHVLSFYDPCMCVCARLCLPMVCFGILRVHCVNVYIVENLVGILPNSPQQNVKPNPLVLAKHFIMPRASSRKPSKSSSSASSGSSQQPHAVSLIVRTSAQLRQIHQ